MSPSVEDMGAKLGKGMWSITVSQDIWPSDFWLIDKESYFEKKKKSTSQYKTRKCNSHPCHAPLNEDLIRQEIEEDRAKALFLKISRAYFESAYLTMFITASDLTGSSFSVWICFTARILNVHNSREDSWKLTLEYMEIKGNYWHRGKLSWYQIVWGPLVCNINSLLTQTPCFQSPGRCWECLPAKRERSSSASSSPSSSPERRGIDTRPSASTTTLASRKYLRWGQSPFLSLHSAAKKAVVFVFGHIWE